MPKCSILKGIVIMTLALATLAGSPRAARADRVDDLIRQLARGKDYKVRLSAALNLGRMGDKRAVPALTRALSDDNKTVRGVAAAALGKLVDGRVEPAARARAVSALERVARTDPDRFVKTQASKSYAALRHLSQPSRNGERKKRGGVWIEVGPMTDATRRAGRRVRNLMRQTVGKVLAQRAPNFQSNLSSGRSLGRNTNGKTAFYIDGTLVSLDVTRRGVAQVSCNVSILIATYPGKSMFGFAKGGASVEAGASSHRAISQATDECVGAVVEDLVERQVVPTIKARAQ